MPIEIRELIIKAQISDNDDRNSGSSGTPDDATKQKIVQECVDMVMDIIKKERER